MTEFYVKFSGCFLFSVFIFVVMMKKQAKKEREADAQFDMTLKSKGMNPNLEE